MFCVGNYIDYLKLFGALLRDSVHLFSHKDHHIAWGGGVGRDHGPEEDRGPVPQDMARSRARPAQPSHPSHATRLPPPRQHPRAHADGATRARICFCVKCPRGVWKRRPWHVVCTAGFLWTSCLPSPSISSWSCREGAATATRLIPPSCASGI